MGNLQSGALLTFKTWSYTFGGLAMSAREAFMENFIGGIRVPAVKVGRFAFTSATEF